MEHTASAVIARTDATAAMTRAHQEGAWGGFDRAEASDLAKEANALRVLPLAIGQRQPLRSCAHLGLGEPSNREGGVCELRLAQLREEVRLILVHVRRAQQLHGARALAGRRATGLRVVTRSHRRKVPADTIVEDSKFDARVAHDVGVGRAPGGGLGH